MNNGLKNGSFFLKFSFQPRSFGTIFLISLDFLAKTEITMQHGALQNVNYFTIILNVFVLLYTDIRNWYRHPATCGYVQIYDGWSRWKRL